MGAIFVFIVGSFSSPSGGGIQSWEQNVLCRGFYDDNTQ